MAINETLGFIIVIVGIALIVFEFIHPGVFVLIPGSILLVIGMFYLIYPSGLLDSVYGPIAIVVVALVAALVEIPYYRHVAPEHPPIAATAAGLIGKVGVVTTTVVPDSLRGKVRIDSEIWSARANREIPVGARIRVVNAGGVSVEVALDPPDQPVATPQRDL